MVRLLPQSIKILEIINVLIKLSSILKAVKPFANLKSDSFFFCRTRVNKEGIVKSTLKIRHKCKIRNLMYSGS